MVRSAAALILALQVGAGFGAASAELISTTVNAMEVELRVELRQSADSVVAHLVFPGETPLVIPLVHRGDGLYSVRTEVKPFNYQVVFESIGPEGAQSDKNSLTDLGLEFPDPQPAVTTTTIESAFSAATQRWGWLSLGFGAAALSALAFWVLGGRERDQESSETDTASPDPAGS